MYLFKDIKYLSIPDIAEVHISEFSISNSDKYIDKPSLKERGE